MRGGNESAGAAAPDVGGRVVLHHDRARYVWLAVPALLLTGCGIAGLTLVALRQEGWPSDTGGRVAVLLPALCGSASALAALLLGLLVPSITTVLDAGQGVVEVERRRPLGRSRRAYRLDELAGVEPSLVDLTDATYSLALVLRSGDRVRLEASTAPREDRERAAAAIRQRLAPHLAPDGSRG